MSICIRAQARQLPAPGRRQHGVTLIESSVTLSVLAVVVGLAAPSFDQMRQRRQLEGTAALLETDLQHARSLAVASNETVRMSFDSSGDATCYVVHTGAANACGCGADGAPSCVDGAVAHRAVRLDAPGGPGVYANVRSIVFDPVKGTVTPTATLRVRARNGEAIHQVVNIMGRVRSCAPAPGLPGYRNC